MRNRGFLAAACVLILAILLSGAIGLKGAGAVPYRLALPGYRYEFPRDHFNHPDFQTEWWYYTGNLHSPEGRRFGFELTFFRFGVGRDARPSDDAAPSDVWNVQDVWMAHLALSDLDGGHFIHTERFNRAGAGIAGADLKTARVWNGNWQATWQLDVKPPETVAQQLTAVADRFSFDLHLKSQKPPVIHGENGISQKAEGVGRASHYVSFTRLLTQGNLILDGRSFTVVGTTWMDHEFFTNQLAPDQTGWDWFSLQLDDGSEVMLYRLRRKDGSEDPYSSGTYVDAAGRSVHLSKREFSVAPGRLEDGKGVERGNVQSGKIQPGRIQQGKIWTSPITGAHYPVEWVVQIPSIGLDVALSTRLPDQELSAKVHSAPVYWEGAVDIGGTSKNKPVKGVGYLEMTGYAGPIPLAQ